MLEPQFLPIWLTGAFMLALAGWLLAIDFTSRLHRTFALLLLLRGSTFILGGTARTAAMDGRYDIAAYVGNVAPYFHIGVVMTLAYFILVYPRPRTWIATSRSGPWLWMAIGLALVSWYMVDHGAYWTITFSEAGTTVDYGLLGILARARLVLFGLAAWLIAREYAASPRHSAGFSKFLIVAGFVLAALQDGASAVEEFVGLLAVDAVLAPWTFNGASQWMPLLTLPFVAAALAIVARVAWQFRNHETMQEPRWFLLYVAPLPVVTTAVAIWVEGDSSSGAIGTFVLGLWRLAFPFLVTYALLRHQLFEVDVRVKANVARAIMLGGFTVAFFLVMEAAEALFAGDSTLVIGIVAAGLLAPIGQPLRALASKAADRLMPDTRPIVEMGERDRQQFYVEQFHLVAGDGRISSKERHMLDELAFSLKIAPEVAQRIEKNHAPVTQSNDVTFEQVDQRTSTLARAAAALGAAASFGVISQAIEALIAVDELTGGIIASAFVALLIGPFESWVDHLRQPRAERRRVRHRLGTFRHAVHAAWEDGSISAKELAYLDRLQKELGLSWADRKKAEGRYALRARRRRSGAV